VVQVESLLGEDIRVFCEKMVEVALAEDELRLVRFAAVHLLNDLLKVLLDGVIPIDPENYGVEMLLQDRVRLELHLEESIGVLLDLLNSLSIDFEKQKLEEQ
jgi:hypothetical protein